MSEERKLAFGQSDTSEVILITTGEAARLLGVRSINTIKRWAIDGVLEGFRRGGRILVSRRSVERLVGSPPLAEQKKFEADQEEALAPFDVGDDEPLPTSAMSGRKPLQKDSG